MPNYSPKPRTAKADYSPKVRKAFWDALRIGAEENDCTLPQLFWTWIDATPDADKRKWLDTLSRFEVRHKHIKGEMSVEHRHTFPALSSQLRELVEQTSGRTIESKPIRIADTRKNGSMVRVASRSEES
jgi:hypothetical protein